MRKKESKELPKFRILEEPRNLRKNLPLPHKHRIKHMIEVTPLDRSELDDAKIIYAGMANRQILNAFRELRTKLFQKAGKENFVLMVTSVCESGGSSYVGINLGAAIALDRGKTAIVVDCNLYQPCLENMLADEPEFGLADYLEDAELSVDDIIYASGIPRLRIVPAGQDHEPGSELFSSEGMEKFITELKARYPDRYIIIDTPPITDSADTRILQELCDYCMLVVPYGKIGKDQVLLALDAIDKERLVGVVYNDF